MADKVGISEAKRDNESVTFTPSAVQNSANVLEVRGTRRQRSDSVISDASVSIFQRMRQPEYSLSRKMLWFVVVLVCTSVCFWQLALRIQHYWREPTIFQFELERQTSVYFPALTICPAREPFNSDVWHQAFKAQDFYSTPQANKSLIDIWNEFAVKEEDVNVRSSCNQTNYCDFLNSVNVKLTAKVLPTFWGMCLTLSRETPLEFRGASTFMTFDLRPGPYRLHWFGRNVAAQYFLHDSRVIPRHEAFSGPMFWYFALAITVPVTLTEFHFLNSSRNPCGRQADVMACKNKCIDESLDQFVNCSLPFMSSKWPPCSTPIEAKQALEQTQQFYYTFKMFQCPCRRQCHEKIYSVTRGTAVKRSDNRTEIDLQFASNIVETTNEERSYSLSALVSDIGGSLGIFLGVSILSLLKMCESIFDGLKKDEPRAIYKV